MDYKSETKRAYDTHAEKFDIYFGEYFQKYLTGHADAFITELAGRQVLDLGSGPGNHAEYFQRKGLDVLCIDISEEMVRLCREKGLNAQVMDLEDLRLPAESYDGIWAYASFLHIPRERIQTVIKKIVELFKPRGLLGLALLEGEEEGFVEKEEYPGVKRWFTYFTDAEVRKLFGKSFVIVSAERKNVENRHTFLNYIFRRKS